jgi:molybdenum cofactor guanylyltransferase
MSELPDFPICVLAGGASRRFGSNKALALLGGKPIVQHVIDRIKPQSNGPIAINANSDDGLAELGLAIIPDTKWNGEGPLAGLANALAWTSEMKASEVVTVALDLPFLPLDLVSRLAVTGSPSITASGDQTHPVNGIWKAGQLDALEAYLQSGRRSAHGWAKECKASVTSYEKAANGIDPFLNVNTPEDLAKAEAMLKGG